MAIGILLIVLGIAINILVGRRKFYRRNVAGLEAYRSYSSAVFNRFLNKVLRLLGLVIILCGIGAISVSYKKENEEKLKPKNSYHANPVKEQKNSKSPNATKK